MTVSITDRETLSYVVEGTFGVHPGGNHQMLRFTGETLKHAIDFVASTEIRSDRQIVDHIPVMHKSNGDINFELSYSTYDELFEAALQSATWAAAVNALTATSNKAVTLTSTTGILTDDSVSASFANVLVGKWVKLGNFVNAANNVIAKVIAKTSSNSITLAGPAAFVTETVAASATVNAIVTQGGYIENGTTQRSFAIERQYTDLSNEFVMFLGQTFDTVNLTMTPGAVMSGSFSIIGKSGLSADATLAGTPVAATTTEVMAGATNVNNTYEGYPAVNVTNTVALIDANFTLTNNLRERSTLSTATGLHSLGSGKCNVTGSVTMFFESTAKYDKFVNRTQSALAFHLQDSAGNAYIVDFPAIEYTDADGNAPSENQDINATLAWSAKRHATEGVSMRMVRFAA